MLQCSKVNSVVSKPSGAESAFLDSLVGESSAVELLALFAAKRPESPVVLCTFLLSLRESVGLCVAAFVSWCQAAHLPSGGQPLSLESV